MAAPVEDLEATLGILHHYQLSKQLRRVPLDGVLGLLPLVFIVLYSDKNSYCWHVPREILSSPCYSALPASDPSSKRSAFLGESNWDSQSSRAIP